MNPERLLEHFDRISEAPGAIPHLRRFILDLAVRGKLVEQDLNDEPASELLKRIHGEKSRLIKKQKEAAEMDGTGVSLEVPPNWKLIPLIALGTWAIGAGFPKNEQGIQDGQYFFLKVSDMNLPGNEKYIVSSQNFIDEAAAARMRAKIHPSGTIIFPKIGGAIATNKRRILTRGSAIDNNCLGITFWSNLSVDWCYLLLTTLDFTQYQAGTAVPALQQSVLEQIPVSLPPLAEQHRIVAKVDELMSLCDQLEAAKTEREQSRDRLVAASLHHLNPPANAEEANTPEALRDHARFLINHLPHLITRPVHLHHFREAILELGVTGRLSKQLSSDGNAQLLVDQFRLARRKAKKRMNQSDRDLESLPWLPSGWIWAFVDEVAAEEEDSITDGPFGANLKTEHYVQTPGFRVIRLQNIGRGKFREEHRSYITREHFERLEKHRVFGGDLVVAGLVDPFVRCCEVPLNLGPAVVKADCYRFRVNPKISARFALHYLNSPVAQRFASAHHHGMTLVRIGLGNFRLIPFPLPPLAEQHRIVAKVDELMALCDQLEAQLTTTEADSRRLLEAILHEALNPPLEATEQ